MADPNETAVVASTTLIGWLGWAIIVTLLTILAMANTPPGRWATKKLAAIAERKKKKAEAAEEKAKK